MSWNYENYVRRALNLINTYEELSFEVATEQAFAKIKTLSPNTIYVVVKYLSSNITDNVKTQPIQLLVLSEQDSLYKTQEILNNFTSSYNWRVEVSENTYIKQQYNTPVVLSNFNNVSYGYRSLLYISGTLLIMEHVADIKDISINNINIKPLSFSLNYSMSGNTQAVSGENLASTVKSIATLGATMTIPLLDNYETTMHEEFYGSDDAGTYTHVVSDLAVDETLENVSISVGEIISVVGNVITYRLEQEAQYTIEWDVYYNLANVISKIMLGKLSGNKHFTFNFKINNIEFNNIILKLISSQITTAPDEVPGLQLTFMK